MRILPYRNRALGVDARTRDLLGRMTLEEKIRQMIMSNISRWVGKKSGARQAMKQELGRLGAGCLEEARFLEPKPRLKAANEV